MDCHLPKSFLDIPCKIPSQLIVDRLRWSGKNPLRKPRRQHKQHKTRYSSLTTDMLTIYQVGNHVAIQNPITKMWDIYGVITAIVVPFRRYFVKTKDALACAGTVRNRRFLRKRSLLYIAAPTGDHYSHIHTTSHF